MSESYLLMNLKKELFKDENNKLLMYVINDHLYNNIATWRLKESVYDIINKSNNKKDNLLYFILEC